MDRLASMGIFVRVVDTGSFSAVARHHRIGQPAASKAVAQLEEWLGVGLLLRSTRNVLPTEAGRVFYERARRTLAEAEEAAATARGTAAGLAGRLRISASTCFARLHIVPRLSSFLAEHPDLDVDLLLDDHKIDLVEQGIDVALRTGALPDSSMTARRIAQCRRLVLATPTYLKRHGTPDQPSDLANHQAIINAREIEGATWTFRRGNTLMPVALRGRLRINATEGLRAAVLADMGLAIASEWSFTPELDSGAVKPILLDWDLPPFHLSAIYPTGRLTNTKARAFVAFVERCMAEHRAAA